MNKFTNKVIEKEHNKRVRYVVIGLIIILSSFIFTYLFYKEDDKNSKDITDLNSIIISTSSDKSDKKSYIEASTIPFKFAGYDDTTDSYYIVADDKYLYIAYMSEADFNKLDNESIYDNPVKIEGYTKITTDDVKSLAIESYNENVDSEDQLDLSDFDNYFGEVYLDMIKTSSTTSYIYHVISISISSRFNNINYIFS